jgi:transposase
MPRKSLPIVLSESEVIRLEQWIRAGSTPQQVVLRARIILCSSQGQSDQQIAQGFEVQRRTVALWRSRAVNKGSVVFGRLRRGRKTSYGQTQVARIVEATLQTKPRGCDALEHSHLGARVTRGVLYRSR